MDYNTPFGPVKKESEISGSGFGNKSLRESVMDWEEFGLMTRMEI